MCKERKQFGLILLYLHFNFYSFFIDWTNLFNHAGDLKLSVVCFKVHVYSMEFSLKVWWSIFWDLLCQDNCRNTVFFPIAFAFTSVQMSQMLKQICLTTSLFSKRVNVYRIFCFSIKKQSFPLWRRWSSRNCSITFVQAFPSQPCLRDHGRK